MKCLNPNCNREAKHRGLCVSCYQGALRLIASGRTSWAELVANKKCTEAKQRGTRAASWLLSKDQPS